VKFNLDLTNPDFTNNKYLPNNHKHFLFFRDKRLSDADLIAKNGFIKNEQSGTIYIYMVLFIWYN